LAIFLPLLSSFLTGSQSYTFYLSPKVVPPIRKWWRHSPYNPSRVVLREFSALQLSQYDGTNPNQPLYLAIDGEVYDVSANRRMYGPGGSYNTM
jgi:cytochrome b involved in lipid metabolism